MNWEALGAIAELLGAVGVVVTLFYLAVQIRQNTKSVRAATFQETMRDVSSLADLTTKDPDLARVYLAGIDDLASLPIEDRVRFGAFMLSFLRRIENLVYQTEQGMLDPDSWEGLREALRRIFAHPGTVAWWTRSQHAFNGPLRRFVERELLSGGRESPPAA
jgi:hypothetical protein